MSGHRARRRLAVPALLLLALTGCGSGAASPGQTPGGSAVAGTDDTAAGSGTGAAPSPSAQGGAGESSGRASSVTQAVPQRISLSSIGLDRPVTALGLRGGKIDPPSGVVQWYDRSPLPGEKGISVIAGHVTYDGPDVFHRLPDLSVGDTVSFSYADGSTRRFRVYAEEGVSKKQLQRDPRVWGTSDTPVVALITCDESSELVGRHHTDNYVVWARPV